MDYSVEAYLNVGLCRIYRATTPFCATGAGVRVGVGIAVALPATDAHDDVRELECYQSTVFMTPSKRLTTSPWKQRWVQNVSKCLKRNHTDVQKEADTGKSFSNTFSNLIRKRTYKINENVVDITSNECGNHNAERHCRPERS